MLGIYGWLHMHVLNLSVIVIGVYLAYTACQSQSRLLYENSYTIIREKMLSNNMVRPLILYTVDSETRITELIHCMTGRKTAGFLVETDERSTEYISEQQVCSELLSDPASTIGGIVKNRNKICI